MSSSVPRPELFEFKTLTKSNARHNLEHAFSVAERHLGITPLLDPEGEAAANPLPQFPPPGCAHGRTEVSYSGWDKDMGGTPGCCSGWVRADASLILADVFTENPDEKSIITYVVSFYHYFSKMKALAVEGKRIGKVGVEVSLRHSVGCWTPNPAGSPLLCSMGGLRPWLREAPQPNRCWVVSHRMHPKPCTVA